MSECKDKGCAHCAALESGASEEDATTAGVRQLAGIIKENGIAVAHIPADAAHGNPSITHTIGFTDLGFPEVILFGLPAPLAAKLLNVYHAELLDGSKKPGQLLITDYFNFPVQVIEVTSELVSLAAPQAFEYYNHADNFQGSQPKFVQWVLSDPHSRFPWQKGFTEYVYQPLLGEPPVEGADNSGPAVVH